MAPAFEYGSCVGVLFRWISLRRVIRQPLRALLVLFGIALGVATLVATLAVNASIRGAFVQMAERVSGKADLVVTRGESGVSQEVVEALDDAPEVAHVAGMVEAVTREPEGTGPILVFGVDFLGDRYFLPLAGSDAEASALLEDPLPFLNDPRAILLAESLARRRNLVAGSTITLLTTEGEQAFHVRGTLADEGLASAFDGHVAVMYQDAATAAFGAPITRVDVALAEGVSVEEGQAKLSALVGSRGRVERPGTRAQHLTSILAPIERGLYVAGALALLVGMFIIYNAVGVAVAERRREIGILRALGVLRRDVVRMFSAEALFLGLLGGSIGVILGQLLARVAVRQAAPPVSRFYAPIRPPAPSVDTETIIAALVIGLIATLLAAWGPARQAASIDPAESLRRQARRFGRRPLPVRGLAIAGVAILLPAYAVSTLGGLWLGFVAMGLYLLSGLLVLPAVLLGLRRWCLPLVDRVLGVPGRVALDSAARRLDRSALTTGALLLSVSTSVALAAWGHSLERSAFGWLKRALPADLYVTAGSPTADQHNVPFLPSVLDEVRGIDGVRDYYPVRLTMQDVGAQRLLLITYATEKYFAATQQKGLAPVVLEGPDPVRSELLRERPTTMLSENAARKLGKKVGDALTLETPEGPVSFEVIAVIMDYASDLGSAVIDRRWYVQYWDDELVDAIDFVLERPEALESVRAEIRRRLGRGSMLFVVSAAELRQEISRVLEDSLAVFRSSELISLLVAVLGVIGTMLAAVIDRTREIGVLRAIGATRGQVLVSIVVESAFLGLAAVLGGMVVSVPMGMVLIDAIGLHGTGWHFDYAFPVLAALRVGTLVIVAAAVAGVWPGRRAARLDVPEALAYE